MISLQPIWAIDVISNFLLVAVAIYLLVEVKRIRALRPHIPLWMYLHWQVIALTVFIFSHSAAHIIQRMLIFMGHGEIWKAIEPFTGAIHTLTFVVVAVLSFMYRDLETASMRYGTLSETKTELEQSIIMLKESTVLMERDAEEIFQKNRELSALYTIGMEISRSLDLDKVVSAIINELKGLVEANFLAVYLVKGEKIILQVCEGPARDLCEQAATRNALESLFKDGVMQGRTFVVREKMSESGRIDEGLKKEGIQAWTVIPLMAKGKAVGILSIGSSSYDGIDQGQINTLSAIGMYIGIVIENSMLYEELKHKVEDLERFSKFSVGREMRILEMKERLKALTAANQSEPEEGENDY